MECKYREARRFFDNKVRINRNIVECKCIQGIWVNTDVCRELIETLWNVNYITEEQAQKINEGINRNIVECK